MLGGHNLWHTRRICDSTSREDVSLLVESPALRRDMKRYIRVQEYQVFLHRGFIFIFSYSPFVQSSFYSPFLPDSNNICYVAVCNLPTSSRNITCSHQNRHEPDLSVELESYTNTASCKKTESRRIFWHKATRRPVTF